jgi:hypothetical protein
MQIGLGLSLTIPRVGGVSFSPDALFANSEPGVWYDPSDLTTMFQDRAGTTPVTAPGQSVGYVLDKSGRGNHMTAISDAARGTYNVDENGKAFILFDGADDGYVTSTITPGTDKAQVFAGVRKLSDAAQGMIVELSAAVSSNAGSLYILSGSPSGAASSWATTSRGSASATSALAAVSANTFTAPITSVVTGIHDISGDSSVIRVGGSLSGTQSTADKGTGNFLAYPLYIGRRGGTTLPFNGRLYSLIVRFGPNLDAATIGQVEQFVAGRTGVTL